MSPDEVKRLREQTGMTVAAFGTLVGVSWAVARSWHATGRGHRHPPPDLREQVVDGLRRLACQIEDLDPST